MRRLRATRRLRRWRPSTNCIRPRLLPGSVKRSALGYLMKNASCRDHMKFGVVAIGRNEGERLKRCFASLSTGAVLVYVDSGSTDGSTQLALNQGADVINMNMNVPFTAARARNGGFRRLREVVPDLRYVQFIDGDCELIRGWSEQALSFLESHADVGIVCGRLRERFPERSVYNWLCDREWDGPAGEVRACGGNAMMCASALEAVGGFRDDLIAGEEPELCVRLRAAGWRIWRLDAEMALHDAAMTRFSQWWRRAVAGGYAFAQGAYLHGAPPERHWVWESRRAWLWGVWLPLACLTAGIGVPTLGLDRMADLPSPDIRLLVRNCGPLRQSARFSRCSRF